MPDVRISLQNFVYDNLLTIDAKISAGIQMRRMRVVRAVNRMRTGCFSVTSTIVFCKTFGPALPPSQPTVR